MNKPFRLLFPIYQGLSSAVKKKKKEKKKPCRTLHITYTVRKYCTFEEDVIASRSCKKGMKDAKSFKEYGGNKVWKLRRN